MRDGGPTPPQRLRAIPGLDIASQVGTGWVKGDDYLALNVWVPEGDATGLPVMVFIHGGAWVIGHKDCPGHDGSAFARSGVVCVAINYRMGIEGFLPFPGCPTNLSLRDQIFALQWLRDNIAAFGGDPANVTVFGESAGAMSIGSLIVSPLAKGLFRRAIIQSGHGGMTRSIPVMQRLVTKMAKLLGVTPDLAGFAATTPEQGLDAIEAVSQPTARIDLRDAQGREPAFGLSRFLPVHGDDVVPLPAIEALRQGAGAGIEVLIGTNREEMNLYFVPTGVKAKIGGLLAWFALSKAQPQARKVLKAYGLGRVKAGEAFAASLDHAVATEQVSLPDILDVRRTLELRTAELAAAQRTDAEADAIMALAGSLIDSHGDLAAITRHDIAFHEAIARAGHNALFVQIISSFAPMMEAAVPAAWRTRTAEAQRAAMLEQHRKVAQAIAERDPDAALAAMIGHFDRSIGRQLSETR